MVSLLLLWRMHYWRPDSPEPYPAVLTLTMNIIQESR